MNAPPPAPPRRSERRGRAAAEARLRDADLQPHDGLRYIARLFKALALLLLLLLLAEIIIGLIQEGRAAIPTLLVEATRLVVFAALLWAAGDLALMLIESNHDLRATRVLVARLNSTANRLDDRLARLEQAGRGEPPGPAERRPPEAA